VYRELMAAPGSDVAACDAGGRNAGVRVVCMRGFVVQPYQVLHAAALNFPIAAYDDLDSGEFYENQRLCRVWKSCLLLNFIEALQAL
jgi:hypothetical protein